MVLVDQFGRPLYPYAFHTGDIVRTVAYDRLKVDEILRIHTKLLNTGFFIDLFAFHRVIHDDHTIINELIKVFVMRNDLHFHPLLFGDLCYRSDNIIRFKTILCKIGKPHLFHPLYGNRKLFRQIFRWGFPVCFIFRINIITKGFAFTVQGKDQVIRSMITM